MRITFEFPRKDRVELQIKRIVGISLGEDVYLPMIWESFPFRRPDQSWFSFNYVTRVDGKMNSWGLNKAAVFNKDEFHKIVEVYERCTGRKFI